MTISHVFVVDPRSSTLHYLFRIKHIKNYSIHLIVSYSCLRIHVLNGSVLIPYQTVPTDYITYNTKDPVTDHKFHYMNTLFHHFFFFGI